jgi:hypothetical protein
MHDRSHYVGSHQHAGPNSSQSHREVSVQRRGPKERHVPTV